MGKLTRVHPTLSAARKDVSLTVAVETSQDEEITEGDLFFLRIEGDREAGVDIPTVRVKHASYMTKGVTRHWTLHVDYA